MEIFIRRKFSPILPAALIGKSKSLSPNFFRLVVIVTIEDVAALGKIYCNIKVHVAGPGQVHSFQL